MTDFEHLPKAPIIEALLDIRAELPSGVDLNHLGKFQDTLKSRFPKKRQRVSFQSTIQVSGNGGPPVITPSSGPDGFLFVSQPDDKIAQARMDGFSFSQMRPYDRWETFRAEAEELWNLYVGIANPIRVTRVALRYINRIEIPLPMKDFRDYLRTLPEVSPGLPQGLESFFVRLVFPDPETGATGIVIETIDNSIPATPKILPLVLDIDVFFMRDFKPADNEIWKALDLLRTFKNRIFRESLTPQAFEMFK